MTTVEEVSSPPVDVVGESDSRGDVATPGNSNIAAALVGIWLLIVAYVMARTGYLTFDALGSMEDTARFGPNLEVDLVGDWGLQLTEPSRQGLILLSSASFGGLGALVYSARGFAIHFANKRFGASWVPWYLVRIGVGCILGVAVVLAISAGILSGGTAEANIEPAGVAVIGFVAGLASKKAIEKFEELIDVLFQTPQRDVNRLADQVAGIRARQAAAEITEADADALIEASMSNASS